MKDIHDSEILNFNLDFKEKKIELKLISDTNEEFIVQFLNVFSYSFEEPNSYTVLYDIVPMKKNENLLTNDEKFETDVKHLVESSSFRTANDYNEFLLENEFKGYLIYSSIGMHGVVVSKEMKII